MNNFIVIEFAIDTYPNHGRIISVNDVVKIETTGYYENEGLTIVLTTGEAIENIDTIKFIKQ